MQQFKLIKVSNNASISRQGCLQVFLHLHSSTPQCSQTWKGYENAILWSSAGYGSVGETDWKAELEAFGKGVREDANEVQRHAHKAAKEGASRLENLPQQAANARFPRVDPDKVKTQFDQVCPVCFFGPIVLSGARKAGKIAKMQS